MATDLAYVNGDVLRWARETSGYSVADAAKKLGLRTTDLRLVEDGGDWLTYRQAEKAAATYQRSLATFFASTPPEEPPVEVQFRRLRDAPELPWPPEMHHLNRRIARRQAALREIYEGFDEAPPWASHALRLSSIPLDGLAAATRELLGVTVEEQREQNDQYAVLRFWVDAVERLGIFVMQNGDLELDKMRGFVAPDDQVPVIVLNTNDAPRARAFTIVHELGHLVLQISQHAGPEHVELWCNAFAGEVILPTAWAAELWQQRVGIRPIEWVESIAQTAGTSALAAATRLIHLDLLVGSDSRDVMVILSSRGPRTARGGGGTYYGNQIAWFGPTYISLVFDALDEDVVTYTGASALLDGVKPKYFATLREKLSNRTVDA